MAKVTVYESVDDKVSAVEMETVDAREAVLNDPARWSYSKPGAAKAEGPVKRFKIDHAGNRKYNVIDTTTDKIVDGGMDKAAAEAKAAELEAKG